MNTDYVTQTKREEKMQLIREGVIGSVAFILLVALVFFAFHVEAEACMVPGQQCEITPNAFGPGVHMDQYGRVVRIIPR